MNCSVPHAKDRTHARRAAKRPFPANVFPLVLLSALTASTGFAQDGRNDPLRASSSYDSTASGQSSASSDQDGNVVTMDPVVVSDLLGRTILENPNSVAQFSGDDLLQNGVGTSREEIFSRMANATYAPGGFGSFTIRGINDDALVTSFDTGSNNLATVFINQAPMGKNPLTYLGPSLWDVETVEVLRGPQSVFQGPNSLAGAVFYNDVDPNFTSEGRARVEFAEYETINGAITQNIPLVDQVLAARVNFETNISEGYITNITRNDDEYAHTDRQHARVQLLYRPSGHYDTSLNFTYRYGRDRGNDVFGFHGTQTPFYDRTNTYDNDDFYDSDFHFFGLEGHFRVNEAWVFDSVTSIQDFQLDNDFDADLTSFPFFNVASFEDQQLYTQEFRLKFDDDGPARAAFGLFGQYNDYENGFDGFFGAPTDSNISEIGRVGAVFTNAEYDLTDRVTIGGGIRFNYEEREVTSSTTFGPVSGSAASSDDFTDVLPQVSLTYRLDDNQTTGGLISRGYRSGGVTIAPFVGLAEGYDPEYTLNYEWFYRGIFAEGRIRINSNVFYTDWTDQQVGVTPPGGLPGFDTLIENVGNAELYGFELEMEYDLSDEWSSFVAIGYSHTEFGNFPLEAGVNLAGSPFVLAPEWDTSVGLQYAGESGIFGAVVWDYQDESYGDVTDIAGTALDARHLISLKVGYGRDNWRVYAFASNLLDEEYAITLFNGAGFGLSSYGKAGAPRVAGIGFELDWGRSFK